MRRAGYEQYESFLLRLWRDSEQQWRCMLQDVRTGEQRGFRDLQALLEFLIARYGDSEKWQKMEDDE